MANADPPDEVSDAERPAHRDIVAPHANARDYRINDRSKQHAAARAGNRDRGTQPAWWTQRQIQKLCVERGVALRARQQIELMRRRRMVRCRPSAALRSKGFARCHTSSGLGLLSFIK